MKGIARKSQKAVAISEQIEALKRKNANFTKEIEETHSSNVKREAVLNAQTERTIQEFAISAKNFVPPFFFIHR